MNTNRITNKNLKRIAIAAGTTAAALFLSAGLVACGGNSNDTVAVPAQAADLTEVLENVVAAVAPAVEEAPAVRAEAAPAVEATTKLLAKPAAKSTKASKKKPAATVGVVAPEAPAASQSAPAVKTTVAPAPQQPDNTAVTTPVAQPAVAQPAPAGQPSAASSDNSAAEAPAAGTGSTRVSIPTLIGTPNLVSKIGGIDLTKIVTPITALPNCISGYNC